MNAAAPRHNKSLVIIILTSLGAAAFVALVLGRLFLFQYFSVPTASMTPALNVGDYIFVSRRAYGDAGPARGDVVVVTVPRSDGAEVWVKRIVGLPGERIQMKNGILFVNDVPAPQRRIADFIETDPFGQVLHIPQFEEHLPGGRTDVVLDRGQSDFDNTEVFVVPPKCYFAMGDNRDNSDDSRGSMGFVKRDDIIGKVVERIRPGLAFTPMR